MCSKQNMARLGRLKDLAFLFLIYAGLWRARTVLWLFPFAYLERYLGRKGSQSPEVVPKAHARLSWRVSYAVERMSRYTPFRATCLVQALAAKWVLDRRGVPNTLYLGVHRLETGFGAHAWLNVGLETVTGGLTREANAVVATYS